MLSSRKRIGLTVILGLTLLAFGGVNVNAQTGSFQVRRGLTLRQAAFNIGTIGQALTFVPPYALGFNPYPRNLALSTGGTGAAGITSSPYAGSPGYDSSGYSPYGYIPDPFSGYLRGGAEIINAQGSFLTNTQQAYLKREQVRQERVVTRRKMFDEYLYEREKAPTPEDERQRHALEQLERSRNNPPITEVYSGKALNDILEDLRKLPSKPEAGNLVNIQQLPLDEDGLKHINVTVGGGSIGLLKNDGRLDWPVALSGPEIKEQRERINSLAQAAVRQAEFNGQVDPGTITQLTNDVASINRQLRTGGGDLPFDLYTGAKTFLNNLDDAIRASRQRDVGNYFTGKFALRAKTVPELVEHMVKQGLRFAPAVPGDEQAYVALHQAVVNYDLAMHAQTASR